MRKWLVVISFTMMVMAFTITLLNPFGPTILPIVHIYSGYIAKDIEISFWRTPEEAVAAIKAGKADFYVLPITLGANLYNKGFDLVLVGVHEWKVFYLVGRESIESLKDLKGREVYCSHSKGTVVDVLLRYYIEKAGLKPDVDVKINHAQPNEIVALFKAGKVDFAALPEPFVTMVLSAGNAYLLLDFQKEWSRLTGLNERIPIAGLFTTKKYAQTNPIVVNYVEASLGFSTALMGKYPYTAVAITSRITKLPKEVLLKSMSRMVFYYVPINKCKEDVKEFLKVLHEKYPKGLPQLPDEGFYR